jgi:hypothetical protein
MKLVKQPQRLFVQMKKAVLREDLMKITDDVVQAMVLGQMLFWTKTLDKVNDWLFEENKRLAEYDFPQHEYNYGWIYKSAKQMREDLMNAFSEDSIQRAFASLTKCGVLLKRNNPICGYDRKLQYRIDLILLRRKLKEIGWEMTDFVMDSIPQDAVFIPQGAESIPLYAGAIAEIKTETKNKETPIVPNGDTGLLFDTEQSSVPSSPMIANRSAMASRSKAIPENIAVFQTRANRLLGRRDSTKWATNEIKAAANWLDTTEEEWKLLEGFYANRGKEGYYCRTNMLTLLNNWSSEIDKARSKQTTHEEENWKPTTI